jgi:hypothetical protein
VIDLTRKDWSLVTRTEGGKVNFTRGLTLAEADTIARSVNFYDNMVPGVIYEGSDSHVVQTTILGPEGWDGCRKDAAHDYSGGTATVWGGEDQSTVHRGDPICFGHCANCGEQFWFPGDTAVNRNRRSPT